jgi:hypothetical protein
MTQLQRDKCAWFDEKDYFEFFPLEAVKAKNPSILQVVSTIRIYGTEQTVEA